MRARCPTCQGLRQPDELRAVVVTIPGDRGARDTTYRREVCGECRRRLRLAMVRDAASASTRVTP